MLSGDVGLPKSPTLGTCAAVNSASSPLDTGALAAKPAPPGALPPPLYGGTRAAPAADTKSFFPLDDEGFLYPDDCAALGKGRSLLENAPRALMEWLQAELAPSCGATASPSPEPAHPRPRAPLQDPQAQKRAR